MQSLARTLQSRAPWALSSAPIATNAGLRTITTQSAPNWPPSRFQTTAVRKTAIQPTSAQNFRAFSSSASLLKKKDKKGKGGASDSGGSGAAAVAEDPFDFRAFEETIKVAIENLKNDVSKIRAGGRFNPELLENLKVVVDKNKKETVPLGYLAQVIPKGGRIITVLVGDEEYVKPVISAIASSQFSLNPQQDPNNSLQLNVPIPPPTKESRNAALRDAKTVVDRAQDAVRAGRLTVNKRLQNMNKAKTARPDDVRKAKEMMEKIAAKAKKEVDDIFAGTKKVLEQ